MGRLKPDTRNLSQGEADTIGNYSAPYRKLLVNKA